MKRSRALNRALAAGLAALLLAGCGAAQSAPTSAAATPAPTQAAQSQAAQSQAAGAPAAQSQAGSQAAASQAALPQAEVTVDEAMYVNWVNELNWNCELYLEKTVRIQGMYITEQPDGLNTPFSYVYRVGPGCCGTDGDICGLQFLLPDDAAPAQGDWIDVYGTLRIVELEGWRFLVLDDVTLTVDNENRGLENVTHQL